MSRKRDVGMKILVARESCGLSQQALADAIGAKSHQNVYNYESGDREPDWDTLERIAAATGKPLAWFFQDENAAEPKPERPQPDTHALLAQLVAAQVRTEAAIAALAHAQMESRAEAARTSARLAQIEEGLRSLLETPTGGCGEGEETRAG